MGPLRTPARRAPRTALAVLAGLTPAVAILAWQGWFGVVAGSFGPSDREQLEALEREAPRTLAPTGARLIARPLPLPEVPGTSASPETDGTSAGPRGDRGRNGSLEHQLLTLRLDPTDPNKLKAAERALTAELERVGEQGEASYRAGLLSDLAAVRFGRADNGAPGWLVLRALNTAEQAVELAPGLPEALFNRALLYDYFGLSIAAPRAWAALLALSDRGDWRVVAEERWGRWQGSRDLAESSATPKGSGPGWELLAEGLDRHHEGRYTGALKIFGRVAAEAERMEDRVLLARARWLEGLARHILGDIPASIPVYRQALDLYRALDLPEYELMLHVLLAEALRPLGAVDEAWEELSRASSLLTRVPRLARHQAYVDELAKLARLLGESEAARVLFEEAVALAVLQEEGASGLGSFYALRELALYLGEAGPPGSAASLLSRLQAAVSGVEVAGDRRVAELDLAGLTGRLLREVDPPQAVAALDRAISGARLGGAARDLPGLLRDRAGARRQLGQLDAADRDLKEAVRWVEHEARGLVDSEPTAVFFDLQRSLFDEQARSSLERGQPMEALARVIQGRARGLALARGERQPPGAARPLEASALSSGLATLVYWRDGTELRAFVVRQDGLELRQLPGSALAIGRLLIQLEDPPGDAARRETLAALYRLLLAPVADLLVGVTRLTVVPDRELWGVPFSALFDAAEGRFVLEDREVVVVASPFAQRQGPERFEPVDSALVIGDPAFDGARLPGLYKRLDGARKEAQAVASQLAGSEVWSDEAASEARFLAAAPSYDVVHLAAHGVLNLEFPGQTGLALAPDPESKADGLLTLRELAGLRLPHTRLVVLSGCRTGVGLVRPSEGIASLAQAFLAGGVSSVVASLWDVDDEETLVFMTRFYRHLARGVTPRSALLATQRESLATGEVSLATWSAFQVIEAGPLEPA